MPMAADEDELIAAALGASEDDYPAAVTALATKGGARIEAAAVALCEDPVPIAQMLGVDLLVQLALGNWALWANRAVPAIVALIDRDPDPSVLTSALSATGTWFDPRLLAPVLRQVAHPDAEVRQAVAMALPFVARREDSRIEAAVEALLGLVRDPEVPVRDWSTMALGSLIDADSPEIRAALVERLDDDDRDTRAEALAGLARRHDRRAPGLVKEALLSEDVGEMDVKSAGWLADPSLIDPLVSLRGWDGAWGDELEIAIARCDPEQQASVVAEGCALLEAIDRARPGADVRILQELLDPEDVLLEAGPDGVLHWSLHDFMRAQAHDVDAAAAAVVFELDTIFDDEVDSD